jgi:hypothetical protein
MATAAICESARISRSGRFIFQHRPRISPSCQDIYQVLRSLSNPVGLSLHGRVA